MAEEGEALAEIFVGTMAELYNERSKGSEVVRQQKGSTWESS